MNSTVHFNFNGMMTQKVGDKGIAEHEIDSLPLAACAKNMADQRSSMKWRDLPHNQDAIVSEILTVAESVRSWADAFVVLGIGGSALGPIAVAQALCHPYYNELSLEKRGGPRLYVLDNIDPERLPALFDVIDPETTCFNVITKSGGTSETMSQLLIITELLKKRFGSDISKHLIATTDREKGNLIKIAKREGLTTFIVPDGVGGRFSELCPVGLLAAAVCGIDIRSMLLGAADMDTRTQEPDAWKNPAYMFAALQVLSMRKGCNIHVLMPYADSLKFMSDWYAQLWAESLGKQTDRKGNTVHIGQTPVKALGVTDQHSQVQLYTEGPFDKVITFLGVDTYRQVTPIPDGYGDIPDVSFLCGHTQNELIAAEQRATEYAVQKSRHLSNVITVPEVNAYTVGALLYFFEIATAFAGELLDINAFDQPGVEEGKNATYALLGKPGFDQKREELENAPSDNERFILA